MPVTTVTARATAMIQGPIAAIAGGNGHMYQAMAAIWRTVLALPPRLAAITPYRMTQNRSSVTPSSRTRMTMVTHQGRASYHDSRTNAVPVSALSAIGSATLPNDVTWSKVRAIHPSAKSVNEATPKA